jgi:hypothetical protein
LTVSQLSVGSERRYGVPMVHGFDIVAMYRLCRPLGEKRDQTRYIWEGKRRMVLSIPQTVLSCPL